MTKEREAAGSAPLPRKRHIAPLLSVVVTVSVMFMIMTHSEMEVEAPLAETYPDAAPTAMPPPSQEEETPEEPTMATTTVPGSDSGASGEEEPSRNVTINRATTRAAPRWVPFRLPTEFRPGGSGRTSIFSDFPEYTWNSRAALLAEAPVWGGERRHRSKAMTQLDDWAAAYTRTAASRNRSTFWQRFGASSQTFCHPRQHKAADDDGDTAAAASAGVKLYVPWTHISAMVPQMMSPALGNCPVACELTNAPGDIPHVDGYVVDTNGAYITEKYDWVRNVHGAKLILINVENIEGRRKELKKGFGLRYLAKPWNSSFWEKFNLVLSYHSGAMVSSWFVHWTACRLPTWTNTVMPAEWRSTFLNTDLQYAAVRRYKSSQMSSPVLFYARNCDFVAHRRMGFVKQLMQHLHVDSIGKCLNNREESTVPGCSAAPPKEKRPCFISRYPFYLAVENSISLDYVTEKVYEPMLYGSVPIYLGAPNIEAFLPTTHSAIIATDFPSVKALGKYLKCLLKHPELYMTYLRWRERPMFKWFQDNVVGGMGSVAPLCVACMAISKNLTVPVGEASSRPRVLSELPAEVVGGQAPLPCDD